MNAHAGEEHRSLLLPPGTIIGMDDVIIELRLLVLCLTWVLADFAFWHGVCLCVCTYECKRSTRASTLAFAFRDNYFYQ